MKSLIRQHKAVIGSVLAAVLTFLLAFLHPLSRVDHLLTDSLYQRPSSPDHTIRILAIDERTIAKYGEIFDWTREIPARLVEILNKDKDKAPAVLAFDVMYTSKRSEAADEAFAAACRKAGNVVTAVNLVYRTKLTRQNGALHVDDEHVSQVEFPYDGLKEASAYGFANTYLDDDQVVRFARLRAEYEGEEIESFPAAIYRKYAGDKGMEVQFPKTDSRQLFSFSYTGKGGTYEVVSLCDVLDQKIDPSVFAGAIVLVGAYAPGMQDHYNAAISHGSQMYGVEIQANILEAMMEGKTQLPANNLLYSLLAALAVLAYCILLLRMKIVPAAIVGVLMIGVDLLLGIFLYRQGIVMRLLEPVVLIVLVYAVRLVGGYLGELLKKRKILRAFKKYVAPQVVDEVSAKGDFQIELGGQRRHIAVLFVDIRGFTPMSEGLEPDKVVEILNEYLALTTAAIFKNGGTLDKFIGDATMAVFNAPFDLDDYVYHAVCTARDIAAGSQELEERLMKRFGKSVSFGIGVNCGEAVVGNIGCEVRMDYTAIGDTVNTAARLESNAKRGQILISDAVYQCVKDRVRVMDIGVIPLKGKSDEIFVYQVDEVME